MGLLMIVKRTLLVLAAACGLALPALAEPKMKTGLVGEDGQRVQALPLLYNFNAVWVVDAQRVLYRDDSRQYYLVTLKQACPVLAIKGRGIAFLPNPEWRLHTTRSYEIRPAAGKPCDVSEIAKIVSDVAMPMRESSLRRVW